MDGQMQAVQTDEQHMKQTELKQTELHVDAKHPPKEPPGRAIQKADGECMSCPDP
jgi:hypothetical protein